MGSIKKINRDIFFYLVKMNQLAHGCNVVYHTAKQGISRILAYDQQIDEATMQKNYRLVEYLAMEREATNHQITAGIHLGMLKIYRSGHPIPVQTMLQKEAYTVVYDRQGKTIYK